MNALYWESCVTSYGATEKVYDREARVFSKFDFSSLPDVRYFVLNCTGTVAFVAADHAGHGGEKEWTGKPWLGKWVHNTTDRTENWDAFIAAMPGENLF